MFNIYLLNLDKLYSIVFDLSKSNKIKWFDAMSNVWLEKLGLKLLRYCKWLKIYIFTLVRSCFKTNKRNNFIYLQCVQDGWNICGKISIF